MCVERVERNKINKIDIVLCMSKELKESNTYCNFYPLCCRMVREVSYRESMKHHDDDPEPPVIRNQAFKAGSFIKCPLHWTQGAIKAIHPSMRELNHI